MPKCDLLFGGHDRTDVCEDLGHRAALARRREGAVSWSAIVRRSDDGGRRDFLDGDPLHCGAGLELQAIEWRDDDYGSYTVRLATGARVRYELDAVEMLAPGGRLVAIVANGPKQQKELRPRVDELGGTWEELPEDTFREQGTWVRAALIAIEVRT